jgi:hypothetical protein
MECEDEDEDEDVLEKFLFYMFKKCQKILLKYAVV